MCTTMGEGIEGARLHTHSKSAELFYILGEQLQLLTGSQVITAEKGDLVEDLSKKEQEELQAQRQASETAEIIYHLVQEFFHLVHARQGVCLDSWIASVEASAIPELQCFAKGLGRDKAAVLAGLTLVHNNGQTEGQVARMKLIKRMLFGRAGFALLRQRVLHRF